jgi:hypothetical protein
VSDRSVAIFVSGCDGAEVLVVPVLAGDGRRAVGVQRLRDLIRVGSEADADVRENLAHALELLNARLRNRSLRRLIRERELRLHRNLHRPRVRRLHR